MNINEPDDRMPGYYEHSMNTRSCHHTKIHAEISLIFLWAGKWEEVKSNHAKPGEMGK